MRRALLLLLVAAGARAASPDVTTIELPHFVIEATPRAAGAVAHLAQEIEGLRATVVSEFGADWSGTTRVRVGWGRAEYEALAPAGWPPPKWAEAVAYPDDDLIVMEAHAIGRGDGQQLVRHELIHIALAHLGKDWPRWFHEGLAMALTYERAYRRSQFETMARAQAHDKLYRLADLTDGFPNAPEDAETAYAQSTAFVEFLAAKQGRHALLEIVAATAGGTSFNVAVARSFSRTLDSLENEFRAELPSRYPGWAPALAQDTLGWGVTSALLIAAIWRRRVQVAKARRGAQSAERLEDIGYGLLQVAPANESPPAPYQEIPWLLVVVHHVEIDEVAREVRTS